MPRRQKFVEQVGVFQTPGSDVWCIRVKGADGTKTVREVGLHTDAVNAYLDHDAAKRLGITPYIEIMRGPTFEELVDVAAEFFENQKAPKATAKAQSIRGKAEQMKMSFGNRVAATLTTLELENWLLDRADENEWSASTQNKYKYCLVEIFRQGLNAKLIKKNPATLILSARNANRRIRFFSEEEEQRLRQITIERAERNGGDWEERLAQFDVAINTGMRKSEQFGLTWDRVHLDKDEVFLETTKNGHSRDVFLNQRAKAALMFMKERHDRVGAAKSALVFPGGSSTKWFDGVLEEAGIRDAVWYTFRHTTASRLVISGVHITLVQLIMGHRTLVMTSRYAHLAAGHLLAEVEKIVPGRRPFFGE